jgi:hypothetical protein
MKITINNGVVIATSETKAEALALVSMSLGNDNKVTPQEEKSGEKRTYNVKKPCEICGLKFKGKKAMGLHKAKKHSIHSPNYEKNRAYYKKTKDTGLLGDISTLK